MASVGAHFDWGHHSQPVPYWQILVPIGNPDAGTQAVGRLSVPTVPSVFGQSFNVSHNGIALINRSRNRSGNGSGNSERLDHSL